MTRYIWIACVFFGCSRYVPTHKGTAKLTDIKPTVVSTPTMADLEVHPKRVNVTLVDQQWNQFVGVVIEKLKQSALLKLQRQSKADVLVEVQYYVDIEEENKVKVTVSAYPATYRNFRSITHKDLHEIQKIHHQTQSTPTQSKKPKKEETQVKTLRVIPKK